MFAVLAAFLIALDAVRDGLEVEDLFEDLFELGLAAWALHFGVAVAVPFRRAA